MLRITSLLLLFVVLSLQVKAQTPEREIQTVIETLFDGMRAGDSSMVASTFIKNPTMETIAKNREGKVVKSTGSLSRFLNAVGTPHDQVWDERIGGYDIKIDAELATVWTPYQFYVGEDFSHCGVNSFQLAKLEAEWKIIYIVDTRRGSNCVE